MSGQGGQNETSAFERNTGEWTRRFIRMSGRTRGDALRRGMQLWALEDVLGRKDARILDVGCGTGAFLRELAARGFTDVHGIEPNAGLLEALRQQTPELAGRVRQGLSWDMQCPDGHFDVVCFINVLHHLRGPEEYEATLDELDRALAPGGTAILYEPCRKWIYAAKRGVFGLLSPLLPVLGRKRAFMLEEREVMDRFIDNAGVFRAWFARHGYRPLRDRKVAHQWICAMRKPGGSGGAG